MTTLLAERVNGHLKGREAPPELLHPFTFQGTGRTVQIRKLSGLIRDEARRQARRNPADPEPQPPIFEVDYGEGTVKQPNPGHPLYVELHAAWERRVADAASERLINIAIRRGVVCEIDQEAVKQVKADMAAASMPLDEYDDHYIFVAYVCCGPYADWNELLKALFDRAGPTEAVIAAHEESFRGNGKRAPASPSEPRSAD
jgi:hypothetical protein